VLTDAEETLKQQVHGRKSTGATLTQSREDFQVRIDSMRKKAEAKFRALDADGNGALSLEEVVAGASLLDLSEVDARLYFTDLDADGSGEVDLEEFLVKTKGRTGTRQFGRAAQATKASASASNSGAHKIMTMPYL
jgi:hypothetical protein